MTRATSPYRRAKLRIPLVYVVVVTQPYAVDTATFSSSGSSSGGNSASGDSNGSEVGASVSWLRDVTDIVTICSRDTGYPASFYQSHRWCR